MKYLKFSFFILIIFFLASCSLPVRVTSYTDTQYNPTNTIDVIRTNSVSRDYIELAELRTRVGALNRDKAIINIKEKAKEIGADAIIILGEETQGAIITTNNYGATAGSVQDMVAIAIKYK